MLACKRLRIDPCDGSPVVDYRIEKGCVESRTVETAAESGTTIEKRWHRLTPEQLTSHRSQVADRSCGSLRPERIR